MLPDIGPIELFIVAIITILVVGPKDLPKVIKGVARAMAAMRNVMGELRASMDDFVREAELEELRDSVNQARKGMDVKSYVSDVIDPGGEIRDGFKGMETDLRKKPQSPEAGSAKPEDKAE